ncbi:hypothetical protein BJ912DRAFT_986347 [Pholiota molesta]|nr:hypothetical protein BJ912DRAFT_986347 [Pholiota molesta]
MPVYEIFVFPASDAFVADPAAALKPAREFMSKVDGCLSVHGGAAEEEKTGYLVVAWETYEHHLALMKREGYPDIIGLAPVFGEGDPKLYHVDFIESPETALAQNATEILIMTLKEGKTKEDLAAAIAVLGAKITAEEGCSKPLAWGETREEPGKTFFSFLGWESSKRHVEVVGQNSYETPIQNMYAAADIKIVHVDFKKVL